jgi:hypothetical protein
MRNVIVERTVAIIAREFPTFGGGKPTSGFNPVEEWTRHDEPTFATGVSVEAVVRRVLQLQEAQR